MKSRPEYLLDRCLNQLDDGGDVEEILAAYPEMADELRPALAASEWMRAFAPPPRRRLEQKGRFVAAVAERRRLVERVDGLVVEIKAGVSPEEIGARLDASLRPVIAAAHRMYVTDVPQPAPERMADGRARLMAMAAERRAALKPARAAAARSVRHGMLQGLLPKPTLARRLFSSAAAASLAITLAFAGVVRVQSVAASSLPGEAFYGVKRLGENARMLFAFDPARRATLETVFAERRMQELVRLDAEGRAIPVDFVEEWLEGNAATGSRLSELTRDQRAALSRVLRTMSEDEAARARLESSGLAPGVLDSLLVPEATAPAEPTSDKPLGLHRGPSLRPQPLPEDHRPASQPVSKPHPAPPVVAEPSAAPSIEPGGFIEALGGPGAGDPDASGSGNQGSTGGGQASGSEPQPDEPVVEPPDASSGEPTDEPPPFMEPFDPGPQTPPDDPSGGTTP